VFWHEADEPQSAAKLPGEPFESHSGQTRYSD
jgi:hypothetical protein